MASLRFQQKAMGIEPSSGQGDGVGARSARPSAPSFFRNRHQHCRRRVVAHALTSSSGVGEEQPATASSSSSSRSSSSSSTSSTPYPVSRPPKGDIKPSGYSVADWAAAFESQLQEFDYDIETKGLRGGRDGDSGSSSCGDAPDISFVEGEIPLALRGGTLYRNGPSRFERGGERYAHMLDGDGYVCRFEFSPDGSKVGFSSRFVKTRELAAEEYADRILYRSTFGTQRGGGNPLLNAFDFRLKNPANTNVVPWGGKLLALWEAGPPYELDPRTLETRPAPATLGGLVSPGSAPSTTGVSRELDVALGFGSALTAHPHVVPAPPGEADVWYGSKGEEGGDAEGGEREGDDGGERAPSSTPSTSPAALPAAPPYPSPTSRLATWAWQSQMTHRGPVLSIEVAEFDARWRRVAKAQLSIPGAAFNPHDFGVSPRHYVFFQNDTTFSMLPYVVGLKGPAQCVKVGLGELVAHVAPRGQSHPQHAPRSVAVRADEGGFLIHHAACFEDEDSGEIVVWSSGWAPEELKRLSEAAAPATGETADETAGDDEDGGRDGGATASVGARLSSLARRLAASAASPFGNSRSDDSMLGSWKVVLNGDFDGIPHSTLQEHRIDVAGGKITRRTLFDDQAMEHPKINPLYATSAPRYVHFTAARSLVPGKAAPPQAIVKLDVSTGEVETWAPGRRCFCEEVVFVPDAAEAADARRAGRAPREDAGYLLSMVFDASVGRSSLVVLDARCVEKGPVARVWLRSHVPHGLHGEWCAPGAPGF